MSSNLITNPNIIMLDPTGGGGRVKPIANGKFYYGEIDKDPLTNPIQVYFKDETGQEVAINQPLTTNNSGAFIYNQALINPYTDFLGYSTLALDKNDVTIYRDLNVGDEGNIINYISTYTDLVFDSVADMQATNQANDSNLKTLAYNDPIVCNWTVKSSIPAGDYGVPLASGNFAVLVEDDGDFRRYGGSQQVGFDNVAAINAALDRVGYCDLPVPGEVEIHGSLTSPVRLRGAIGTVTELKCVGANGGNYFITRPENLRDIVIKGDGSALQGVDWSHPTAGSFAGWMVAKNVIVKGFLNVAANIKEVFALAWDNVRILQNGALGSDDAVQIRPLDLGGDDGYFTTIYWKNVYINQNNSGGLRVAPSKKSPLFVWDGVVIEENCLLSGTRQAYVTKVDPFKITSLYLENGSVTGLILDNIKGFADSLYLNNNTNEAIKFENTTADFTFKNVKTTATGNNTITADGGAIHKLSFEDSSVNFTGGTLPNIARLELENTIADGVEYSRYLGGTTARSQLNSSDKLRSKRVVRLTGLNQTIPANGRIGLAQDINLGSIMVDTVASAALKSFQPDVVLIVTPATTGSQDFYCVFAQNLSASPITLSNDECYISFERWDFS